MDTWVNIQVLSERPRAHIEPVVQRAQAWFETVERICTRFDPASEVMQLMHHVGQPVKVSTLLFEVTAFALDLAAQTDGAFDPTIGATLEQLGFNVHYRSGEAVNSAIDATNLSYRDVHLDRRRRTVLLRRPLVLDLNAVCKGLAIDLAVQELAEFADVSVEAGGDLYVRGHNIAGEPWRIGIQHPRAAGLLTQTLEVTDTAVCTSGDYERRAPGPGAEGHILDGRTHQPVTDLASVTVVAPTTMAADGLSTAAMVLGRHRGQAFLEEQGVGGVLVAPDGSIVRVNL
ncbi:MAG TPA: FAD:protein FMN transferase [Chloroflexota bacterium]|jgi:thiamine biosynthesis lipoprotein|nr:FAD:protein FMN transferase [Chloroflexota bacterium]